VSGHFIIYWLTRRVQVVILRTVHRSPHFFPRASFRSSLTRCWHGRYDDPVSNSQLEVSTPPNDEGKRRQGNRWTVRVNRVKTAQSLKANRRVIVSCVFEAVSFQGLKVWAVNTRAHRDSLTPILVSFWRFFHSFGWPGLVAWKESLEHAISCEKPLSAHTP